MVCVGIVVFGAYLTYRIDLQPTEQKADQIALRELTSAVDEELHQIAFLMNIHQELLLETDLKERVLEDLMLTGNFSASEIQLMIRLLDLSDSISVVVSADIEQR